MSRWGEVDTSLLGPRDQPAAARIAVSLVVVAAVAMGAGHTVVYLSGDREGTWFVLPLGVVLLVTGLALWFLRERVSPSVWMVLSVAMVGAVLAADLVTSDAGGGAQVAFLYPVVYAGAFLRPRAAWVVAGAAIVADAVVAYTVLPPARAVSDQLFVLVAIVALTHVLVTSGRRQDALVAQLNALASVDTLTGLATRRVLEDAARRALADQAAEQERRPSSDGMGLIVADIDLFKELNDAYGHPAGDAVLVHTAAVLSTAVRPGDTVARLGGDELAVLLPGVSPEAVRLRAEALRRSIRDTPLSWEGQHIHVTVSLGVAHTETVSTDLDELYAAADAALYRAKRQGRNRVVAVGDPEAEVAGDRLGVARTGDVDADVS